MNTIGTRLREERLRLGLSQDEFAAVGGVLRRAQSNYEADERSPDAKYLSAVAELGVDVVYVLRGRRSASSEQGIDADSEDDERYFIDCFRQLNETGKATLQSFIGSVLNQAVMLKTGTPQRAKRLPENRRAALDQRAAENVDRAMAEIERLRAERAAKDGKK
ncbi:transcriptional regulator [Burkholderia cepacia]|uniref:Helix-turn-helix domain-containing protein n=2 Tax=Burkholderia TaxID=32008 RepID=A0ABY5BIN4_BURGL|nr:MULTISPECIES: helix-turn-helix transcriptional regulator [Burkholderia]MCR1767680.1 helix-turn-helix transcriptional regulator [Burkholderia glumae]PQP16645.1 transcriptional regulator [Burkholderia cepacia]USS46408.1 helix-turn-helix domain-containing protein [Burkholderia glumae]UVS94610.1 XRE family transcriptional regulator [Burkholderia glumae]HDR9508338.1 helix-turn-helix transcriptional regulator [Burkholderia cepacia]